MLVKKKQGVRLNKFWILVLHFQTGKVWHGQYCFTDVQVMNDKAHFILNSIIGVGKTQIVKNLALEYNINFFPVAPSDIYGKYIGEYLCA